jgi:hypothetical protein
VNSAMRNTSGSIFTRNSRSTTRARRKNVDGRVRRSSYSGACWPVNSRAKDVTVVAIGAKASFSDSRLSKRAGKCWVYRVGWCFSFKPYKITIESKVLHIERAAEAMPRVYFDNLANAVTRDDVEEYFSRAGKVRGVLVVTDKASGKSRGFGCVDMEKLDDALHAIKWLNHADLKGKRIRIHPGPLREQN